MPPARPGRRRRVARSTALWTPGRILALRYGHPRGLAIGEAVDNREGARPARLIPAGLGIAVLVASLVIGGNLFSLRDTLFGTAAPPARPAAFSRIASSGPGTAARTKLRSQPWWQTLDTFDGSSALVRTLTVDRGALQWRARWRCSTGRLVIRASTQRAALVDRACPASGTAFSTHSGETRVRVAATGAWHLALAQQIDVPLEERALPDMKAPVATAKLYGIDQKGRGTIGVFRLPDGRYALRLEDLYVTPNVDLELRLSPLRAPRSTHQFHAAPSRRIAPLDITAGSMNVVLARGGAPPRGGSIVVGCPPVQSAYAAATLKAAG